MSLRVHKRDGRWALWNREWDGIDKPDHDFIRYLTFEEAVELVASGKARDVDGHVARVLQNPLQEIAEAAADGNEP